MSDYPPAPPYGAYSQPQMNIPYQQQPYPNQYIQQDDSNAAQPRMTSDYNASAYAYNSSIPGFSAMNVAPTGASLPMYQGWNRDNVPIPSYLASQNNPPYAGYGYQAPQSYISPQTQAYQQNSHHVAHYDEGELSEGEFDAYGSQNNGGTAVDEYGSNYYQGNDGTGYMNTAHRALYPNGQEYNNSHFPPVNEYNSHPRESNSFSPYAAAAASPLEAGQNERWKGNYNNNAYPAVILPERPANNNANMQSSAPQVSHSLPSEISGNPLKPAVDLSLPPKNATTGRPNSRNRGGQKKASPTPIAHHKLTSAVGKSVAEYRKKAEGAILNLWSREVRFPDYIEEGLNADIVGSLFDELGFSKAPKGAVAESKPTIDALHMTGLEKPSYNTAKVVDVSSGEGVASRGNLIESNGSTATAAPTIAPTQTEPTEKEKNLKMKMEALRKSRAERAQKAAAKTSIPAAAAGTTIAQPELKAPLPAEPNSLHHVPQPPPNQLQNDSESPIEHTPADTVQELNKSQPSPPTVEAIFQPQPIIPGLFLASTSSTVPLPGVSNTVPDGPPSKQRKRPVAADFDTPASSMPHKRPFGQTRNDSLVIDVSEEELESDEEDVAMDLESQADQESPVQASRKISDQRTAALHEFPPLTNFPSRRAFISTPGSSAASTPPINAIPRTTIVQPQDLQQTEKRIEELKKKIAAAEAAKAAKKRAQQISSGAVTPQNFPVNDAQAATTDGDIASKVEASLQIQQMIHVTDDKVAGDEKRLAETQAAEQDKAAELKRQQAESRRLRRNKLAADLPRVDAEVEESQRKIRELREAMAKIEASVQKSMEEKRRMAEEMERLGQEAEDHLQEQKTKLDSLIRDKSPPNSEVLISVDVSPSEVHVEESSLPSEPIVFNSGTASTGAISVSVASNSAELALPSLIAGTHKDELVDLGTTMTANTPCKEASVGRNEDARLPGVNGVDRSSSTADQALEAALQEQVRAEAGSQDHGEEGMDIENDHAPDPAQLALKSSSSSVLGASPAIVETQALIDYGDIPVEQLKTLPHIPKLDVEVNLDHDDDYEPPEATRPLDLPPQVDSPPFSPAPPESVTDFEQFSIGRGGPENSAGHDEDELNVNGHAQAEETLPRSNQVQFFTPYESPLKYFRAFRFHPEFKQQVPGGLKSMTYSHKINPNIEFCRFELAGGVCNDHTCDFQHFRDIALPDDAILTTLGNPAEFPAHQQQKFREGLKNLLIELRKRNVRDFDTIANEVLAHRSNFLNDPSKVLMLEGTTI